MLPVSFRAVPTVRPRPGGGRPISGPMGARGGQWVTGASQDLDVRTGRLDQMLDDSGLADAGLAEHQGHSSRADGGCL